MTDIRKSTERYVSAFDARDLDEIARMLAEDFELTDHQVTALKPKSEVIEYIRTLFTAHKTLHFVAHNIIVDDLTSVINFTLTLNDQAFDGVDIITWTSGHMKSLTAYLERRK